MGKDVMIALDFPNAKKALGFLEKLAPEKPYVKVGMELFYAEGPDLVRVLKEKGYPIFLDLKLHDIPHTVEQAMRRLAELHIDMTNIHASGGIGMMQAARRGFGDDALLIGVTQLTSTSQEVMNEEIGIPGNVEAVVKAYAQNCLRAELNGVVCSPLEAPAVHEACGPNFLTITPGVRFAENSVDDQKRVTTPARARELGSDYIVVGRAITGAEDPAEAYKRCIKEFVG